MHRTCLLFEPLFDVCDTCTSVVRTVWTVDVDAWQRVARGSVVLW
jgi:hypothetical protein